MENNGIGFLLDTDWIFEKVDESGIDYEYLKYKLLSYFNKLDDTLKEDKLYPIFSEVALHFTNIESMIINKQYLVYDKKITFHDEDLRMVDLEKVAIPDLDKENEKELNLILEFAEGMFLKYFSFYNKAFRMILKSTKLVNRVNEDNVNVGIGFMQYIDDKNVTYLWEYELGSDDERISLNRSEFNLIYSGETYDIVETIKTHTKRYEELYEQLPIFKLKSPKNYPIIETILPIFKRKVIEKVGNSILDFKISN